MTSQHKDFLEYLFKQIDPVSRPQYIAAMRAFRAGQADLAQQKMCWEFLLYRIAGINQMSYVQGSDRDTAFNEGRRYVGGFMEWVATESPAKLEMHAQAIRNKQESSYEKPVSQVSPRPV